MSINDFCVWRGPGERGHLTIHGIVLMAMLLLTTPLAFAGSKPPLVIAYFVPSDRTPIPGYVDRLDRVMTEVQVFYRRGMETAGYGPTTFDLARDKEGKLTVYVVRGKESMHAYGRGEDSKVRTEVAKVLRSQGVAIDHRTLVIFELLLEWKEGRTVEVGPYVGAGDHLAGTAWVYDDALLDPQQLASKAPGAYYAGPCSIGAFNSHYIGGVAHELGHAFGLPHVAGPASNPKHSLMGDGNHTYGEELRGEGAGSYLHPTSAMLLAKCRPFAGEIDGARTSPTCDLKDQEATFRENQLILSGHLKAQPAAFGIIAFNDSLKIPGDYDARGWVSKVDSAGRFRLSLGELQPGPYELRLQVCHLNGASSRFSFQYNVNSLGVPDLKPFAPSVLLLQRAVRAYGQGDSKEVQALTAKLEKGSSEDVVRQAKHLLALLQPPAPQSLATIPANQKEVSVSGLQFVKESVGWGRPLRDQVLVEDVGSCFLQVDGQFFDRGLFAHAPSNYSLNLDGQWKRFKTGYGLQDGHAGSVVFVILGDERELFRSERIINHRLHSIDVDIQGIKRLELVVEDAADGANSDWGVWISPTLKR
jgi:hypothetical protein